MATSERFDGLPPEARAFVTALENLLMLYMPGTQNIEMMVGRNCIAKLNITGGPITQETLSDVMAHLGFYRKYFPKNESDPQPPMSTPQGIIDRLAEEWAKHRAASVMPAVTTVLIETDRPA